MIAGSAIATTAIGTAGGASLGADLDLPTPTISGTGSITIAHATIALVAPAATISASYYGRITMDLIAPSPLLSGRGGGNAALAPSAFTLSINVGGSAALSLSALRLAISARSTAGENAASLSCAAAVVGGWFGGVSALTAPTAYVTASGTGIILGRAELVSPSLRLSASGSVSSTGRADLTFGPVNGGTYNLVGYSGAVLSVTLAGGTLTATGTGGGVGRSAIALPLFELTATGTGRSLSFAELTLPALRIGATARAALVMPFGVLTAIGSAVVAVSYEAYALNLNHKPRGNENPVDELTRYTNYPFDRIVRYQNSYFGMNSTGLFLLEGTTDDATPVDWNVQTAFTDFDTPQNKTVEMAYFGGRFGPSATVSLFVGENNTKTYTYTTPRDTDAQNYRQPFGRGNKARYYALGANGSGTMTIDSITFNVATLARKV